MRIIYFTQLSSLNDGVAKKIVAQVKELNHQGIETQILNVTDDDNLTHLDYCIEIKKIDKINPKKMHFFEILKRDWHINIVLSDQIKKSGSNDVIYLRFPYPSLFFLNVLAMKRKCKIVIEHQTIEPLEYKLKKKYEYLILDLFFGRIVRRNVDGIVGMTEEITSYQVKRSGDSEKPHTTISNGIDVSSVPLRQISSDLSSINILCIANNISKWHGFDRLLHGLAHYRGNRKICVYIIGAGDEVSNLKGLVEDLHLDKKVIFTGHLTGSRLNEIFDFCHIAVGSLGIHRIGMKEACVLKVREYYSRGIPFVYGYRDPDICESDQNTLQIPGNESPVDMDRLIEFVDQIYCDLEHPVNMRKFAEQNLDWSIKIKNLFNFLSQKFSQS